MFYRGSQRRNLGVAAIVNHMNTDKVIGHKKKERSHFDTPLDNQNTPSYTTFMTLTALIAMWKTFSEPSNYDSGFFFFNN